MYCFHVFYCLIKIIYYSCQLSSSQAKGTNSTSFLTHPWCVRNEVELVPLACEDGQLFFLVDLKVKVLCLSIDLAPSLIH